VIGFVLRWKGQENGVLWISGDTVLFDGVREVGRRFTVGTAVIHLGGVRFPISGPLRYTMTAEDAVHLGRQLNPQTIVPVHCEGWKHFRQDQSAARDILASSELGGSVLWLEPGTPTEVTV
jgi:L-ascorbate metabolism protein UlaG (beta-lactamase superfamily)